MGKARVLGVLVFIFSFQSLEAKTVLLQCPQFLERLMQIKAEERGTAITWATAQIGSSNESENIKTFLERAKSTPESIIRSTVLPNETAESFFTWARSLQLQREGPKNLNEMLVHYKKIRDSWRKGAGVTLAATLAYFPFIQLLQSHGVPLDNFAGSFLKTLPYVSSGLFAINAAFWMKSAHAVRSIENKIQLASEIKASMDQQKSKSFVEFFEGSAIKRFSSAWPQEWDKKGSLQFEGLIVIGPALIPNSLEMVLVAVPK